MPDPGRLVEDHMTLQTLRGKAGRAAKAGPRDPAAAPRPIPIGEDDSEIFTCPTCDRPLATGVSRCPGCRTHLVMGIPLRRAVARGGVGLIVALAIGGGVIGAILLIQNVVAVGAVPSPAAASHDSGATPVPTVDPPLPALARSGLRQTSLINQRLATDAGKLAAAMATHEPGAADIAHALRTLAADATFGASVASNIGAWTDGAALSKRLATFYDSVGSIAANGLDVSITNRPAYLAAGRRMLSAVGELRAIDAAAQELAASVHLPLTPVTLPKGVGRP
jgi:hypothetical protein